MKRTIVYALSVLILSGMAGIGLNGCGSSSKSSPLNPSGVYNLTEQFASGNCQNLSSTLADTITITTGGGTFGWIQNGVDLSTGMEGGFDCTSNTCISTKDPISVSLPSFTDPLDNTYSTTLNYDMAITSTSVTGTLDISQTKTDLDGKTTSCNSTYNVSGTNTQTYQPPSLPKATPLTTYSGTYNVSLGLKSLNAVVGTCSLPASISATDAETTSQLSLIHAGNGALFSAINIPATINTAGNLGNETVLCSLLNCVATATYTDSRPNTSGGTTTVEVDTDYAVFNEHGFSGIQGIGITVTDSYGATLTACTASYTMSGIKQ